QQLFRDAHTIKGNALSLGFPALGAFAHRLEDRLESLRDGSAQVTPELVTLLLGSVDALRDLLADAMAGVENDRAHHRTLLERLEHGSARPAEVDAAPTLRVSIGKLDRMLSLSGEIAIARGQVRRLVGGDAM